MSMQDAIGSLCTGYGGLDAAVAQLFGLPVAWHSEIDPSACAVLKARHPDVRNVGDLKLVDWRDTAYRVAVLAAGFPCQAVSAAGKRQVECDPRWLWPSVRLSIAALRPEIIALENVANLVSIRKGVVWRGILDDLAALGYRVAWGVFGACRESVGGCHHRHRVFALARLGGMPGDIRWTDKTCGVPRGKKPLLSTPAARDGDGRGEGDGGYWDRRSALTGRTNGVPLGAQLIGAMLPTPRSADASGGRIDLRERTNGASLPTAIRLSYELLPTPSAVSYGSNQGGAAGRVGPVRHSLETLARMELLPTPRASEGEKGSPNQHGSRGDLTLSSAVQPERFGRFAWSVDRWSGMAGLPPEPLEEGPRGGMRLRAQFPEWMMGISRGHVTDVLGRKDALRVIGNGVFPLQAFDALSILDIMLGALDVTEEYEADAGGQYVMPMFGASESRMAVAA